MAEKERRC